MMRTAFPAILRTTYWAEAACRPRRSPHKESVLEAQRSGVHETRVQLSFTPSGSKAKLCLRRRCAPPPSRASASLAPPTKLPIAAYFSSTTFGAVLSFATKASRSITDNLNSRHSLSAVSRGEVFKPCACALRLVPVVLRAPRSPRTVLLAADKLLRSTCRDMQRSESDGKMSRRRNGLQLKHRSSSGAEPFVLQTRKRKAETLTELQPLLDEHSSWKKRHLEVEWSNKTPSPCRLLPTPQKDDNPLPESTRFTQYRFNNLFLNHDRPQPLPKLSWANSEEVWSNLLKKEQTYIRDKNALLRHPALQPRMRAILLDWLIEVCEVYRLRRETFYLAQDFFDRFLSTQQGLEKTMLQLIGITSLFIAAKAEEIYPPKLVQFAYVTDGACTDDEILRMELILLKALQWSLCPVTVNCWLNLYLQIATKPDCSEVLVPHYSQETFIRIAQVIIKRSRWDIIKNLLPIHYTSGISLHFPLISHCISISSFYSCLFTSAYRSIALHFPDTYFSIL
uniref:Cyclin E1 n=2 Tax=Eptatretus burgeri TaxID=7764 RepID=A0A8C4NH81_EPTBU